MSRGAFKDHFSGHAAGYRAARPGYPAALYDWLATLPAERRCAWDAGCGNGQASRALAAHFETVIATDPSAAQIAHAEPQAGVRYRVEPAEASSLDTASVDLVTVAQALHWFDVARFHAEARRVAKPGAVLAAWTYALCAVTPAIDTILVRLYEDIVGPYWPPERRHTEDGYASLPFPFAVIEAPAFAMQERWTLPQFHAYLQTWSATQRYLKAEGRDPVALIAEALARAWGEPATARLVRWPLAIRAGRLN
ncbi:MAG: class I SAM-dependent methyltransferase [Nevskia sp.]